MVGFRFGRADASLSIAVLILFALALLPMASAADLHTYMTFTTYNFSTSTTSATFSNITSFNYTAPFFANTSNFLVVVLGSQTGATGTGAVGEWRVLINGVEHGTTNKTLDNNDAFVIKIVSDTFFSSNTSTVEVTLQHRRVSATSTMTSYNATIAVHSMREVEGGEALPYQNYSFLNSTTSSTYAVLKNFQYSSPENATTMMMIWGATIRQTTASNDFYFFRATSPTGTVYNCTEVGMRVLGSDFTSSAAGCVIRNTSTGTWNITLLAKRTAGTTTFDGTLHVFSHEEAISDDIDYRISNVRVNTTFRKVANATIELFGPGLSIYSLFSFNANSTNSGSSGLFQLRIYNSTGTLLNESPILRRVFPSAGSVSTAIPSLQVDSVHNLSTGNYSVEVWANASAGSYTMQNGSIVIISADNVRNTPHSPPTTPDVFSPNETFYSGAIDINYTNSTSPESVSLSHYNISLVNPDQSFNVTIVGNNSLNTSYIWDSTAADDATYLIRVEICDIIGTCAFGYSGNFSVDNHVPAINFTSPTETSGSLLNRSDIKANVTASDTFFANVTISLYDSAGSLVDSENSTSSPLYADFTGLADGLYYFNATAYDQSGQSNSTETLNATLDSHGPSISVQFPANGSAYNLTTIDLNYTVHDSHLDSCWYTLNGGADVPLALCANTTLSPGDGRYNITLYANDSLGNENSTNVSFTLDTAIPSISVQLPANTTYNHTSLTVNYTLIEPNPDSCWYTLNGGAIVPLASCANASFTAAEGQNQIGVYANDTAGSTNSSNVSFTVDSIGPFVSIEFPANGTVYNSSTIDFNYTASDIHLDSCWYTINGSATPVPLPGCANTSLTLGDGTYAVFLYANDSLNNTNSTNASFFIHTLPPRIAVQQPQNATYNYTGMDLNYTATEFALDSCWYTLNGGADVPLPGCANTTFTAAEGQNNISVHANDTLGLENSTNVSFTVDSIQPFVSIDSPLNGTTYNISSVDFNYTASDIHLAYCWYTLNGSAPVPLAGCTNVSLTPGDGYYNLTLFANDTAGNLNHTNVSFTIDATPPSISISVPANSTYNYTGLGLNYTLTERNRDSCWYTLNGGAIVPLVGCANTTITGLEGQNQVGVYANDTAGSLNSTNVSFTVDTIAPSVAIQLPANGTAYNVSTIDFNYTASDIHLDSCWYGLNGTLTPLPGCMNTTLTFTGDWHLPLILYANDTAGNTNSTNVSFHIHVLPPNIAVHSPLNATYNHTGFDLNFTIEEFELDSCWYTLNGGPVVPLPGCANSTFTAVEGQNNISVYANDTIGGTNSTNVSFTVDLTAPSISIQSPFGSAIYHSSRIDLNFTVSDLHPDSCWYLLDGGVSVPLPGCQNSSIRPANGPRTVAVFANDTAGNVNYSSVSFISQVPAPPSASGARLSAAWASVCPGNSIMINVSSGGRPVEGASVRLVLREPNAGEIAAGTTGGPGSVSFTAPMNGTYNAYIELSGYTYGNPLVFTYTTCPPPIPECVSDGDCAAGEVCTSGECVQGIPAQPEEQQPAQPPAPETPPGGTQPGTGQQPAPGTLPECTSDSECAPGFGCMNGSCITGQGNPAAGSETGSAPGAAGQGTQQPQGFPWWLALLVLLALAYAAYRLWFANRKRGG